MCPDRAVTEVTAAPGNPPDTDFRRSGIMTAAGAPQIAELREHETRLQRVVTVWIVSGLLFMLAPGTFLGVLNLIGISNNQSGAATDPAWLQAHGHAQIFGWI